MNRVLLLVSASKGRARLLEEAGIDFEVIGHNSDENIDPTGLSPEELVAEIAKDKMNSIQIPDYLKSKEEVFALTGDTLVITADGQAVGKPKDLDDARATLRTFRQAPVLVVSGCVLTKFKPMSEGKWARLESRVFTGRSQLQYSVPDHMMDWYFQAEPSILNICGGATIEGPGAQFTEWIEGCYTTIVGLPMFALRRELEEAGFFEQTKSVVEQEKNA